jgi:Tfp pilus assembly PilM family ATPase
MIASALTAAIIKAIATLTETATEARSMAFSAALDRPDLNTQKQSEFNSQLSLPLIEIQATFPDES